MNPGMSLSMYLNFKRPFLLNRTFNKEMEPEIFPELGQVALGLICLIISVLYSGVHKELKPYIKKELSTMHCLLISLLLSL